MKGIMIFILLFSFGYLENVWGSERQKVTKTFPLCKKFFITGGYGGFVLEWLDGYFPQKGDSIRAPYQTYFDIYGRIHVIYTSKNSKEKLYGQVWSEALEIDDLEKLKRLENDCFKK